MLEQCAQRVAKGRDALLPAYCTFREVIHARANLKGGVGYSTGEGYRLYRESIGEYYWGLLRGVLGV